MIFDLNYNYWIWLGTFYLIILSVQDFREMTIDDRKNWFMMGITISILTHLPHSIWYILLCVILVVLWSIALKKFKVVEEGDVNSLAWVYLGFTFISLTAAISFLLILFMLTLIHGFFKAVVFKYKLPTPFFYVILTAFILNNLLWGLY